MYYDKEELLKALNKATEIINKKTKDVEKFTWGYNDCFCFLIEYDKQLRGKKSQANSINFSYNNAKDYLRELRKKGHTLKSFAEYCNYEIRKDLRPQFGDIAYQDGSAIIAGNSHWVTTDENNFGVKEGRRYYFLDRHLSLLARPLRS
jgi:hypothetical protein